MHNDISRQIFDSTVRFTRAYAAAMETARTRVVYLVWHPDGTLLGVCGSEERAQQEVTDLAIEGVGFEARVVHY